MCEPSGRAASRGLGRDHQRGAVAGRLHAELQRPAEPEERFKKLLGTSCLKRRFFIQDIVYNFTMGREEVQTTEVTRYKFSAKINGNKLIFHLVVSGSDPDRAQVFTSTARPRARRSPAGLSSCVAYKCTRWHRGGAGRRSFSNSKNLRGIATRTSVPFTDPGKHCI